MKTAMVSLLFTLFALPALAETNYGSGSFATEPIKLSTLKQDYEKYQGQKVVIRGEAFDVCTMEGCWLKMQDGNEQVRVLMKDQGFKVPKEIKGKMVKAEGYLEHKEMPAKVVQHYMKDEGRPQKEIDKVTTPQKVFQFVADGVRAI